MSLLTSLPDSIAPTRRTKIPIPANTRITKSYMARVAIPFGNKSTFSSRGLKAGLIAPKNVATIKSPKP